jgi:hypothetical protein
VGGGKGAKNSPPKAAVFCHLFTKATRMPGRFNLVKTSQIANLSPINSVEKSDLVKTSQIVNLAPIDSAEKSDLAKTSQIANLALIDSVEKE